MHIVIVGNGIAGNIAALTIKRNNPEVNITLISEENHPLYSPCVLPYYLSGVIDRKQVFLKSIETYSKEGIRIILGEKAESIDINRKKVFLPSQAVPYDKLVIATGSQVVIPPIDGLDKKGVFTFKSIDDADRLCHWSGKKAVVIGSGFIGIEVAIALKRRGYQVQVIELLDWILPRAFDEYPAFLLARLLEENGIEISVKERVNCITGDTCVNGVITERREIKCDTVVIATGMKPNAELAQKAGINIGKLGGIEVDETMLSSALDVYACGDCIETKDLVSGKKALNLLWHNAKQQAKIAANNCLGKQQKYSGSINITGIDIFGVQAVSMGVTSSSFHQSADRLEIIEKSRGLDYLRLIIYQQILVGIQAIGKIKELGFWLRALLRKEDMRLIETKGGSLPYYLWQHYLSQYLSQT